MQFETHIPIEPLNKFIECLIYFKGYMPDHSLEKVVPDGGVYLIFELDGLPRFVIDNKTLTNKSKVTRAWISGIHSEYITISTLQNSEMLVVKFKPFGAFPFLHCSLVELKNRVIPAEEIVGQRVIKLRNEFIRSSNSIDKMKLCEEWLISQLDQKKTPPEYIVAACEKISKGATLEYNSIADLVLESKVSRKHFSSQFRKYVGLTPKLLQRVFRFNEILSMIQKEEIIEWSQIALSCGYYDQAHFIKEFYKFCGINPTEFILNYKKTDRVNFFPLD